MPLLSALPGAIIPAAPRADPQTIWRASVGGGEETGRPGRQTTQTLTTRPKVRRTLQWQRRGDKGTPRIQWGPTSPASCSSAAHRPESLEIAWRDRRAGHRQEKGAIGSRGGTAGARAGLTLDRTRGSCTSASGAGRKLAFSPSLSAPFPLRKAD